MQLWGLKQTNVFNLTTARSTYKGVTRNVLKICRLL